MLRMKAIQRVQLRYKNSSLCTTWGPRHTHPIPRHSCLLLSARSGHKGLSAAPVLNKSSAQLGHGSAVHRGRTNTLLVHSFVLGWKGNTLVLSQSNTLRVRLPPGSQALAQRGPLASCAQAQQRNFCWAQSGIPAECCRVGLTSPLSALVRREKITCLRRRLPSLGLKRGSGFLEVLQAHRSQAPKHPSCSHPNAYRYKVGRTAQEQKGWHGYETIHRMQPPLQPRSTYRHGDAVQDDSSFFVDKDECVLFPRASTAGRRLIPLRNGAPDPANARKPAGQRISNAPAVPSSIPVIPSLFEYQDFPFTPDGP